MYNEFASLRAPKKRIRFWKHNAAGRPAAAPGLSDSEVDVETVALAVGEALERLPPIGILRQPEQR